MAERDSDREERFLSLYAAACPLVLAYALRRAASPQDAADVCAETFAIAWRRLDELPDGQAATMWLYATARKVLANAFRRRTESPI